MPAVPARAWLDGRELTTPTASWRIREEEHATLHRLALGDLREQRPIEPPEMPLVRRKRRFVLEWKHLDGASLDWVEERLALPGTHTLVLWRAEHLVWRADGTLSQYRLPNGWSLAADTGALPSGGLDLQRFGAKVRVGESGSPLTVSSNAGIGNPPPGEVWFAPGGDTFRLSAPPAGERIFGSVVPIYTVLREPTSSERTFANPNREPRMLTLSEI